MTIEQIDAALRGVDYGTPGNRDDAAVALGDLLDKHGAWDWYGSDHAPSDRAAVVRSSNAWWCVYRGTEADKAWLFASEGNALARLDGIQDAASGYAAVSGTEIR